MSFANVRPHFRTIMDGLDFNEWDDGFNFENIPETIIDGAYHLGPADIDGGPATQIVHNFGYNMAIRVFRKGFRNVGEALDEADATAERILNEILKPSNRMGLSIKDVVPNGVVHLPLDASNDNGIITEITITAKLACSFS